VALEHQRLALELLSAACHVDRLNALDIMISGAVQGSSI